MNKDSYEDIINLPHHTSTRHPRMPIEARAAQFAPFAALTGYEDAVRETARITDDKIEIDEGLKVLLNDRLQIILDNIKDKPEVTFTYFIYDKNKEGGKYVTVTGKVNKIDMVNGYVILTDKTKIPINEIINITSYLFNSVE